MQTYRIETIIEKNRVLTIRGLPFRTGEKVEVIILSQPRKPGMQTAYSLRGQTLRYNAPFDPIADDDQIYGE